MFTREVCCEQKIKMNCKTQYTHCKNIFRGCPNFWQKKRVSKKQAFTVIIIVPTKALKIPRFIYILWLVLQRAVFDGSNPWEIFWKVKILTLCSNYESFTVLPFIHHIFWLKPLLPEVYSWICHRWAYVRNWLMSIVSG